MTPTSTAPSSAQKESYEGELLNLLQNDFPLVRRPFAEIGKRFGRSEGEILSHIEDLKRRKIIRQISAIFDTRALGYKSSLVAAKIDEDRLSEAAQIINEHPGVSHNYARNHAFNLWFTLAISPEGASLETTVARLGELAGARSIRLLPTIKLFKIGMTLDMTGKESRTARREAPPNRAPKRPLDDLDRKAVLALQDDLPLVPEPFAAVAPDGLGAEALLERARDLKENGYLRRFAAVLYHRKAGFKHNGMGVWKVPEERIDEVGAVMASFRAVSHCYRRPTYPDWPYSLFTMVHGRTKEECEEILDAVAEATGVSERAVLYSTVEFKKTRVRYFTGEEAAWEAKYLSAACHRPRLLFTAPRR